MMKTAFTVLLLYSGLLLGQSLDLDFQVKDASGSRSYLDEHFSNDQNYLLVFNNTFCSYCQNLLEVYNQEIAFFREHLNMEIFLIYDEDYHPEAYEFQDYMDYSIKNQLYFTTLTTSERQAINYPSFYFKGFDQNEAMEVRGPYDGRIQQYVESKYRNATLDKVVEQKLLHSDCTATLFDFIPDHNDSRYHTDLASNSIFRENSSVYSDTSFLFNYSLNVCESFLLMDKDGDKKEIEITSKVDHGNYQILYTDAVIDNSCLDTVMPFILDSRIGSSAGIEFDIVEDKISTLLVCSSANDSLVYSLGSDSGCEQLVGLLEDTSVSMELAIFPNPLSSNLLFLKSPVELEYVVITDIAGRAWFKEYRDLCSINVDFLPSGIYFVHLGYGSNVVRRKLIRT